MKIECYNACLAEQYIYPKLQDSLSRDSDDKLLAPIFPHGETAVGWQFRQPDMLLANDVQHAPNTILVPRNVRGLSAPAISGRVRPADLPALQVHRCVAEWRKHFPNKRTAKDAQNPCVSFSNIYTRASFNPATGQLCRIRHDIRLVE